MSSEFEENSKTTLHQEENQRRKSPKYFLVLIGFLVATISAGIIYKSTQKDEDRISSLNVEDLKESSQKVAIGIKDPKKQTEFIEAMRYFEESGLDVDLINGYTADQVIKIKNAYQSEDDKKNLKEKTKESLNDQREIMQLIEKRLEAEQSFNEMAGLVLESSRLQKIENSDGTIDNVVEINVRNETPYAISGVIFDSKITSPGRTIPWVEQEFEHKIPGGIEPGESAIWRVLITNFNEWTKIQFPQDANFSIVVAEIKGIGGKTILPSKFFTEEEKERLMLLQNKYNVSEKAKTESNDKAINGVDQILDQQKGDEINQSDLKEKIDGSEAATKDGEDPLSPQDDLEKSDLPPVSNQAPEKAISLPDADQEPIPASPPEPAKEQRTKDDIIPNSSAEPRIDTSIDKPMDLKSAPRSNRIPAPAKDMTDDDKPSRTIINNALEPN